MKKFITLGTVLLSAVTLAACGNNSSNSDKSSHSENSSSKVEHHAAKKVASSSSSSKASSKSSSSVAPKVTSVNKDEILAGNLKSLDGTWKNSHGYSMTIKNGKILSSPMDHKSYTLVKPESSTDVITIAFSPAPRPNGMWIMVAPKGITVDTQMEDDPDGTDSSRDRIIMGNNGGAMLFAEDSGIPDTAYYRN